MLGKVCGIGMELLDRQQQFAGGLARFQVAVGGGRLRQRVHAADGHPKRARCHPAEDVARPPQQLVARQKIMAQAGRVRNSEPLAFRMDGSKGATGPLD